jgi:hypothetical protein
MYTHVCHAPSLVNHHLELTNNYSSSSTPTMASTSDAALKEEIARLTGDLVFYWNIITYKPRRCHQSTQIDSAIGWILLSPPEQRIF